MGDQMVTIDRDINHMRSQVINNILIVMVFLVPITAAASISRSVVIGWKPVMAVHVALAIGTLIVFWLRDRLTLRIKAVALSSAFIVAGIVGVLQFGVMSPAYAFFNTGTFIIAVTVGMRAGIIIYGFCVSVLVCIAYQTVYLGLPPSLDLHVYITAPQTWATVIIAMVLCVGLVLFVIETYNQSMIDALRQAKENEEMLRERTDQLELMSMERDRFLSDLKVSEQFKSAVFNSLPSEIAVLDRRGVIIDINDAWSRFSLDNSCEKNKAAPNTGIGSSYLGICQSTNGAEIVDAINARNGIKSVLDGILPIFTMEYPCHSPITQRWFSMVVSPLGSEGINGVVITHTNITKIKQAEADREQALLSVQISEGRLQTIFDASPDSLLISDADGAITMANNRAGVLLGYSVGELIGQSIDSLVPHLYQKSHPKLRLSYINNSETRPMSGGRTVRALRKDGTECEVEITLSNIAIENTIYIASALRDISERRRAEGVIATLSTDRERLTALSRELALFKKIIDNTNEAVSIADNNGIVIYTNAAHDLMHRVPGSFFIGRHYSDFIPPFAANLLPAITEGIASCTGWCGQLPIQRSDDSIFISASNIGVVKGESGHTQYIFNIFNDFTPELERRNELEAARHDAECANRAKSEFLSQMSHELRTPLNAVLGFTDVLLWGRNNSLNDKQRSQLGHIRQAGEHLLSLINEVLDLAKIEAGHVALEINNVKLHSIIDECLSLSDPIFSKYGVSAINKANSFECDIVTDPRRARQLILNLLSNAAKYNCRGGTVEIGYELLEDGFHRVCVSDTGGGIAEDKQGGLFIPFNRLGAESSEIEGTGIGLALTKKLIEAMDGRIGYASVVGEGSRFWLDFPPAKQGGQETEPEFNTQDATLPPNFPEALILYIEDNVSNQALVEAMIEQLSPLRLIFVTSAETGLIVAENNQPDIILLDINLPGMDGFAAIGHLKENPRTRHIPVVALSADAIEGTADRALACGFSYYLTKPVRRADLIHTIQRVMRQHHAMQN